jgi:hypothetical protein
VPYVNGRRVSLGEYLAANGSTLEKMRTGPNGENPGEAVAIDPEIGAPKPEKKSRRRSGRSEKAAKAAIANALGTTVDSPAVADVDVSGNADEESE